MAQSPDALPAGTDIGGYQITHILGQGGFGITYRAVNPVSDEVVAVKEFFPRGHASRSGTQVVVHSDIDPRIYEGVLRRFEDEAKKLITVFRHHNIVRGKNFIRAHGSAFLILDFVNGMTISEWLASRPSPPGELEIRAVMEPILDAVDYVHELGGMHRDISPRNIMISNVDGHVHPVLIDFGSTAEGLDLVRDSSTVVMANETYAPPEQLYPGHNAQGRYTDVFALAGSMYYAAAGFPPPKAVHRMLALTGKGGDPYEALAKAVDKRVGDFSEAFLAGVDAGLELNADDRPQSVAEFRELLGWIEPIEDADTAFLGLSWPVDDGDFDRRPATGSRARSRPPTTGRSSGVSRPVAGGGPRVSGPRGGPSSASRPTRPPSNAKPGRDSAPRGADRRAVGDAGKGATAEEPGRRWGLMIAASVAVVVAIGGYVAYAALSGSSASGPTQTVEVRGADEIELRRLLGPPRAPAAELISFANRMQAAGKTCYALQAAEAAADLGDSPAMTMVATLYAPDTRIENRCKSANIAETARYLAKAARIDGPVGQERLLTFCRRIPDLRASSPPAQVALAIAECRT